MSLDYLNSKRTDNPAMHLTASAEGFGRNCQIVHHQILNRSVEALAATDGHVSALHQLLERPRHETETEFLICFKLN